MKSKIVLLGTMKESEINETKEQIQLCVHIKEKEIENFIIKSKNRLCCIQMRDGEVDGHYDAPYLTSNFERLYNPIVKIKKILDQYYILDNDNIIH